MPIEVVVPELGPGMKSGVIAEWYRPDGAAVRKGDPVYRLECGFTSVDVEAACDGILEHRVPTGNSEAPGQVVAVILPAPVPEPARSDEGPALPPGQIERRVAESALDAETGEPLPPLLRRRSTDIPAGRTTDVFGFSLDSAAEPPRPTAGLFGFSSEGERRRLIPNHEAATPRAEVPATPAEPATQRGQSDAMTFDHGGEQVEAPAMDWGSFEAPVKDPSEPVRIAEDERDTFEPIPFPVPAAVGFKAELRALATGTMNLRTAVRMTEALELCAVLGLEWGDAPQPAAEDLVIRAVARAVARDEDLQSLGDRAGLVLIDDGDERIAVIPNASHGAFRANVEALHAAKASGAERPCGYTVTSFAPFGLDEGTPLLPGGHPFAVAMGAVRPEGAGKALTLTLAYAFEQMTVGHAAALLAHVRELLEAPHTLLAE
jgi:hypothetical protein